VTGRRIALIVATDQYTDDTFQRLHAPGEDAVSLAAVLADAAEHPYEVNVLRNAPAAKINRTIERALLGVRRDDVILLYFSGHGIKDDAGNLYFAAIDSEHLLPGSTMVAAHFVRAQLDRSHCGRKIVLLDCCFGGAFPRGHLPRGKHRAEVLQQLAGQGCAILTASTALEFAYEPDDTSARPNSSDRVRSFFTSALVDGLRTGSADLGGDGWIDSDELYRYVADELRISNPRQSPSYDCKFSGRLVVAANPHGPRLGFGLPDEIVSALHSPLSGVRAAATPYLRDLATEGNAALSDHAGAALNRLAQDADPDVRTAAKAALERPRSRRRSVRTVRAAGTHEESVELVTRRAEQLESIAGLFVNLTRRSQALVERQLAMLDHLEREEQDPDQLANLFELDHLATRLRRNSESLLLLSGVDLTRTPSRPVPISALIGAAISEIEQYARVDVAATPHAEVVGRIVNDIVHLIAELLDNATAYSPPEERVSVQIARTRSGELAIQITDRGVGMTNDELSWANERLIDPPDIDESVTRRMGLFVVGQLAHRHGIRVQLHANEDGHGGVTALVVLPAGLLTGL
jgi:signal transduction histidine kinase